MKNGIRRISTLLMALALVLSLSVPAFASSVTFEGKSQGFALDGHNQLTATDLFGNFKNLMPGDSVSETITIQNVARDCDYIKLYIRAVSHNDWSNIPDSEYVEKVERNVASISDHRLARSTWKQWRQEVRKARDIGAESIGKGRKESEKTFLWHLGPGCREFESRHSDHEKRLFS